MYIVLIVVALIYIWRIFQGSRNGLIDEVGALADIVIVSLAVVAGIILLVILIARKLLRMIFCSLGLIAKLPILNGLNRLLGTLAGVIEATVVIWVGFAVISCLRIPINGEPLVELITANKFLDFLYQHNVLYNFIQRMIGIFL